MKMRDIKVLRSRPDPKQKYNIISCIIKEAKAKPNNNK